MHPFTDDTSDTDFTRDEDVARGLRRAQHDGGHAMKSRSESESRLWYAGEPLALPDNPPAGNWEVVAVVDDRIRGSSTCRGAIALDAEGCIYVGDWRNDRVQKLSPTGEPLMVIGSS